MKSKIDIQMVRNFQKWVKESRENLGISYQQAADRYNAAREEGDASWSVSAIRRLEDREVELATINKQTCRRVALALGLPVSLVLMKAGYIPSAEELPSGYDMPDEMRIQYAQLPEKERRIVQDFVQERYKACLSASNQTGLDAPESK